MRSASSASRSLLDASGAQARLPVPLQHEEGDDDGDDREQRSGDHEVVDRLRGGAGGLGVPLVEPDRERVPRGVAQHDEGEEVVVPRRDDGEQQHRDDAGGEQPDRDREERAELPRAVHAGGLEQLGRHGVDRVDPDQVEAERADERRDDDRPRRVREAELAEHEERRHGERGARDRDRTEHDGEHRPSPGEPELREAVAGQRREQRRAAGAEHDVEQRVAEPAQEDPVAIGERLDDVLAEHELVAEPQAERREQAALGLPGVDHEPDERHEACRGRRPTSAG